MLPVNSFVDSGRFRILDVLGKGGSGIAYLAIDTHSSPKHPKYYAIKCVPRPANDTDASSLLREIRLHKLVSQHPGIVTLKRCIQEGPYQLFIMDFLPGGDLFKQITQQRTSRALNLCRPKPPSSPFHDPVFLRLERSRVLDQKSSFFGFSFFALPFPSSYSITLLCVRKCSRQKKIFPSLPIQSFIFPPLQTSCDVTTPPVPRGAP